MKIINHLIKEIRSATVFNPEVQIAPACILWPDNERQWEAVIPILQAEMPELLILGEYAPDKRTGPAIWLRCALARRLSDVSSPENDILVIYLPGISRQDLRAVESCPEHLKPLAELQYRGVVWSQINAKDWTVPAYLKSNQGGLGLDVAKDNSTRKAMQRALHLLLDEDVDLLQRKHLYKDYFNALLIDDPIRDLLKWLDSGDMVQTSRSDNEWKSFVEVCKSKLAFDPQNEGLLAGASKLAAHEGAWLAVWDRFCEAPKRYSNIPAQIGKCQPPSNNICWTLNDGSCDGWPQWNEVQEKSLRQDLAALASVPAHTARERILELEAKHGRRRDLVWGELGTASLARALKHLAVVAEYTKNSLAAGSVNDLTAGYSSFGWKVDDSAIKALSCVEKNTEDFHAVATAIRAVYLPWAEESARYLQKIVEGGSYPGETSPTAKTFSFNDGDCVLFVDGLRFDVAKQLVELLHHSGFEISEETVWAALPSVTATGKAAVSPVKDKISGKDGNVDFEPVVTETGQSINLKTLLKAAGWTVLDQNGKGVPHLDTSLKNFSAAWHEFGNIDHEGHDRGWKLALHLDSLISEVKDRIAALLSAGWKRVQVVTDHGWLLLPDGLPKIELPGMLTENKWGRCASLKPGVSTKERLYPWFWNPNHYFALADGISCFRNGEEYAHGGLSLQECLTLRLTVTPGVASKPTVAIDSMNVVWKGLRCTVAIDGDFAGLFLDIRRQAGDATTSVIVAVKPFKDNGTASVIVEDETLEGNEATVVLVDEKGALVAQTATVIGQ